MRRSLLPILLLTGATSPAAPARSPATTDLVVYGCTPAGIAAAVEARRLQRTVTLICRDAHVGGMSTNGLGWADTGNHSAIGGLARQFYRDVKAYYVRAGVTDVPHAQSASASDDPDALYVFEPHVAEAIYERWLREAGVVPVRSSPLRRDGRGVVRAGTRLVALVTTDGRRFAGRQFVDASYEGDLMAEAGVGFATGREPNAKYGETINGVQGADAVHHNFDRDVDPFVIPGQPESGLLPRIEAGPKGPDGAGDTRIQAYTYRLCMTQTATNRVSFPKPAGYDPKQYELLGRYLDAGWRDLFAKYDRIPNAKTDTNNHGAFSTDDIGMNYAYPTGNDAVRAGILDEHRNYEQGLLWFMQNDPRSPADVRASMRDWGLCRDEFADNGHWPREIYVREARRMVADFVMTERHLRGLETTPEPIGLGSYTMDSHNVRRYVDARGFARNEGDVQVSPGGSYRISYRSITPKRAEATNLLVPVALSSSHIAYGSIRMEPVFAILGQSAAQAASLAIERNGAVQDVPYPELRARLLARGQVLDPPAAATFATGQAGVVDRPWFDSAHDPDERAALVLAQLTLDEKLGLVSGSMPNFFIGAHPADMLAGAGYVGGVPRLGIPPLRETDAGMGVANLHNRADDYATGLPSNLGMAATWDPTSAFAGGVVLGNEARAKGFNVVLGGGANLVREPRNGRNFEYPGEDPLLAGVIAGEAIRGVQSAGVISTLKHYALNAQESGRKLLDARITEGALQESDLLAFKIAIEHGAPGSVMCSYNRVNGPYACESPELLTHTLRRDWGWRGWVMSDWGAVHSTVPAVLAGLDQESGRELDRQVFLGAPLKAAVLAGTVPPARLDEMVSRILRTMFAAGVVDRPTVPGGSIDLARGGDVSQAAAERSLVLLRNRGDVLPLARSARRIAVIGGNADVGVLMGGGSSSVVGPGGNAREERVRYGGEKIGWTSASYHRSPLVAAIRSRMPGAQVAFDNGYDPGRAARIVREADIAIVVAEQWTSEGVDASGLRLPDNQDALISAVAATGKPTVVVLVTGGPVLMPWLEQVAAVVEAWYPGSRGGEAIARVLFGEVDATGRLPVTFPAAVAQLPRPTLDGYAAANASPATGEEDFPAFAVDYREGADVGYRWFELTSAKPLFPFGFGLGFSTYAYDSLRMTGSRRPTVRFNVRNVGRRVGTEVAQVYARPAGGMRRLVGWQRVTLDAGGTGRVEVAIDPRLVSTFDAARGTWRAPTAPVTIEVGRFAGDVRLTGSLRITKDSRMR